MRLLKTLIASQLILIVAAGALTAVRFPFLSPIDEAAHFDYVRVIAEDHRLPVLGEDKTGLPVTALAAKQDPDASPPPKVKPPHGLAVESYEAFEPPLYYVMAAPAFAVTDDWSHRVKLVRLLGLPFLLAAAALLWLLAGRVLPNARLVAFSVALTVLMWPGVIVRAMTVSNAGLEILAACAFLYVLWCADEDLDERRLLAAGAVFGLALLTKLTLVALAPLLVGVAVRHALRAEERRGRAVAVAALVIPVLVLSPWLIFNLHHFDSLTANGLAREMQAQFGGRSGVTITLGEFLDDVPGLLDGLLPQEWSLASVDAPLIGFGLDYVRVALLALPVVLLVVEPRWLLSRHGLLLVGPVLLGVASVAYVSVIEDWRITEARRLYPELPAFALFAAVSWLRLFRSSRVAPLLAGASSLVLAAAWVDLATRRLL